MEWVFWKKLQKNRCLALFGIIISFLKELIFNFTKCYNLNMRFRNAPTYFILFLTLKIVFGSGIVCPPKLIPRSMQCTSNTASSNILEHPFQKSCHDLDCLTLSFSPLFLIDWITEVLKSMNQLSCYSLVYFYCDIIRYWLLCIKQWNSSI